MSRGDDGKDRFVERCRSCCGDSDRVLRELQYLVGVAADQVQALLKPLRDSGAARVLFGKASANVGMLNEIQLGTAGPVLDFIPIRNSFDGSGIATVSETERSAHAACSGPAPAPGI